MFEIARLFCKFDMLHCVFLSYDIPIKNESEIFNCLNTKELVAGNKRDILYSSDLFEYIYRRCLFDIKVIFLIYRNSVAIMMFYTTVM